MTAKVTILRKWNSPTILITVSDESIAIEMTLSDFVCALTDEVAEPLVKDVAALIGNPTFIFTNEALQRKLIAGIESETTQKIFLDATARIMEEVKKETVKVM
jgi:hypothetical protein